MSSNRFRDHTPYPTDVVDDSFCDGAISSLKSLTIDLKAFLANDGDNQSEQTTADEVCPARKVSKTLSELEKALQSNQKAWHKAKHDNFTFVTMLHNTNLNLMHTQGLYAQIHFSHTSALNKIVMLDAQLRKTNEKLRIAETDVDKLGGFLLDAEEESQNVAALLEECRAENQILKERQAAIAGLCRDQTWSAGEQEFITMGEPVKKRIRIHYESSETDYDNAFANENTADTDGEAGYFEENADANDEQSVVADETMSDEA